MIDDERLRRLHRHDARDEPERGERSPARAQDEGLGNVRFFDPIAKRRIPADAAHRLAAEAERLQHRTDDEAQGLEGIALVPGANLLLVGFPLDRAMHDLRISVMDRCNFRCPYCMPEDQHFLKREELMTREEVTLIAKLFVERYGITKIRLTGGEPLVRKGVDFAMRLLGQQFVMGETIAAARSSDTSAGRRAASSPVVCAAPPICATLSSRRTDSGATAISKARLRPGAPYTSRYVGA